MVFLLSLKSINWQFFGNSQSLDSPIHKFNVYLSIQSFLLFTNTVSVIFSSHIEISYSLKALILRQVAKFLLAMHIDLF